MCRPSGWDGNPPADDGKPNNNQKKRGDKMYAYALDEVDKILRRYYEWLGPDMPSATFDPAYSCEDARRDLHKLIDKIIQP